MPIEVSTTIPTIVQIQAGSIGMKKKATEVTMHMRAEPMKAPLFEPIMLVNRGERAPKIIQVTSPKAISTV